ncbi:MAG: alpha/beta fold hydrolase, partial [Flammeovirgaceae bacterium]|nr:alpha/beta fold hydrolase [Flammeovirgaceae bacterium]MDW8289002.1 alpha/beta fold hydrolase [Flammeovirgaceae bacterium]
DIAFVVNHLLSVPQKYQEIAMVGFSMGGNLTLRYVGEKGELINSRIKKAVAISTPIDLAGCAKELELPANRIYNKRFLKKLIKKVRLKAKLMPDRFSDEPLRKYRIESLRDFDEHFTAPLHGFASAEDFYEKAASLPLIPRIQIPTLLLNASNDPFLSRECYPRDLAKKHPYLHLEVPTIGGHVGFCIKNSEPTYAELRALAFCQES